MKANKKKAIRLMNRHVLCVTLLLAGVTASVAAPPPAPDGYRWVRDERFSEEFNGDTLDANKWHDHHPRWKGRPPAKFVPSAIDVSNGLLHIRAGVLSEPDGPFAISGGAVVSRSEDAFYGYYEARMKASSISMSSTFWMSNRPQRAGDASISHEIDITETVGAPHEQPAWARDWNQFMNSNTHYFWTFQGKKENLAKPGKAPLSTPAGDAFHTYAAWWVDARTIKFYLDDQYQFTLHPSTKYSATPFNRPMHVNMVVETYDWMAPPAPTDLTNSAINTTYYDWVRAYRLVREADRLPGSSQPNNAPGRSGVGGGKAVLRPASDPANTGDWILNQETSDESEGRSLDAPPRETK